MSFRYAEIGERLKAFRLGSRLNAEEIRAKIGISRTALYRLERGEIIKLETLEQLSDLLGISIPTLLGVGTEYLPSAVSYFERLRQIEAKSIHIAAIAGPSTFLLSGEAFQDALEQVLLESIEDDVADRAGAEADIKAILSILRERKRDYRERKPSIVNLSSAPDIERFLRSGFIGRPFLPEKVQRERRKIARAEIEHFASLIEEQSIGVQIGITNRSLPRAGLHIFRQSDQNLLTVSPFRLAEQPNIWFGVAMITADPDALKLHDNLLHETWRTALKGPKAAEFVRGLIAKVDALGN